MRTALVSLIALAGLTTAAVAQPAETPPAATPATPAAPAAPAAAAPADPAAPAQPAAPEAPPQPQRPTSGDGAVVLDMVERICVPLVRGGNADQLAKAYGLKKQRNGGYQATFGAKPYTVTLVPQGSNKDSCELVVQHAVDGDEVIARALHTWAYLHDPELKPYRSDIRPDFATGNQLTTRSWEHIDTVNSRSIGLVFVKERKANGQPVAKNADRSKVLYQERALPAGA